jgi:hypothetical protein
MFNCSLGIPLSTVKLKSGSTIDEKLKARRHCLLLCVFVEIKDWLHLPQDALLIFNESPLVFAFTYPLLNQVYEDLYYKDSHPPKEKRGNPHLSLF